MFTGIVQEIGTLQNRKTGNDGLQLVIAGNEVLANIDPGESIAVNGTCLTVVSYLSNSFTVDVMPETLRNTNLNNLKKGTKVNLEQAVKAGGFFSGHLVTGHIDGTGIIEEIKREHNARLIKIGINSELEEFMVNKGSVAINGVSLTIAQINERSISVSLIPETWDQTIFKFSRSGDRVNIETDLIGKYVVKMLKKQNLFQNTKLNRNFLKENGFL